MIALFTMIAAAMLCTASVSAENSQTFAAAPAKVWYKLVNHDRVSLKWNAVSGADGYYLYKLNSKTHKYAKIGRITKTVCTLKSLAPETAYTYAVTAFKKSGNKMTESAKSKVTFTTPLKWYYAKGNGSFVGDNDPKYDSENLYRYHYDGSGLQKFNYFSLLPKESTEGMTEESYKLNDVWQDCGYIYLSLTNLGYFADDVGCITETYLIKSGGSKLERVYVSDRPDKKLCIDADTVYTGKDSGISNGEELYITEATVSKTMHDKNGALREVPLFKELGSYISNFVTDNEYVYFFTSPYRVSEYDSYDYGYEPSTLASLYRIKCGEPGELTYNSYGYIRYPETDGIAECICGICYDYTDNGINMIGVSGGYLYFSIREQENDDGTYSYSLWRILTDAENEMPEKLCEMQFETLSDMRISGNYLYLLGNKKGCRAKLTGSFKLQKIFTLPDGYFYEYDEYDILGKAAPMVIDGSYIYITSSDGKAYYRAKLNGTNLTKSTAPFVWR